MHALIAMLVAVALSTGCAGTFGAGRRESVWSERSIAHDVAFGAAVALTACDVAGTLDAVNYGRYDRGMQETNPLLGHRPSVGTLLVAPATAIGAVYAVSRLRAVPRWARWTMLGTVVAVEAAAVTANASRVGACGLAGTNYPR